MLPHPASVKYVSALRKRRRSLRMPVHRTRFLRLIIIAFVVPLVPQAFSLQLVPLPYNFPYSIAYTYYADLEMRNDICLDPFSHIIGLPSLNENPRCETRGEFTILLDQCICAHLDIERFWSTYNDKPSELLLTSVRVGRNADL